MTSVTDISVKIGKGRKQTRCYLQDMASLGLVKLNPETGTLLKKSPSEYRFLTKNRFAVIPEIAKWMDDCIARQVKPKTMGQYLSNVKYMFNTINVLLLGMTNH